MTPIKPTNTLDTQGLEDSLKRQAPDSPADLLYQEINFGTLSHYLDPGYRETIIKEIQSGDSKRMQFRAALLKSLANKFTEVANQIDRLAGV